MLPVGQTPTGYWLERWSFPVENAEWGCARWCSWCWLERGGGKGGPVMEEGEEDSLHRPAPSWSSVSKRFIITCQTAVLISSAPQWKIDLISRHIFRAISLIMTGVCKLDNSAFRLEWQHLILQAPWGRRVLYQNEPPLKVSAFFSPPPPSFYCPLFILLYAKEGNR